MSTSFSGSLPLLSTLFVFYYTDFMANKICMYVCLLKLYSLPKLARLLRFETRGTIYWSKIRVVGVFTHSSLVCSPKDYLIS